MDAGSTRCARLRRTAVIALLTAAPLLCQAAATPPAATPPAAASPAAAPPGKSATSDTHGADALLHQAEAAYDRHDYAASAIAYDTLFAAGTGTDRTYYDAACSNALAGRNDQAYALLHRAIDAGYGSFWSLTNDSDLAALRGDARWNGLMASYAKAHPEHALQQVMEDQRKSSAERYFAVRNALAHGLVAPDPAHSPFQQFYATMSMFVGDYATASANYHVGKKQPVNPIALGFDRAVPAIAEVVARAKGRQAVFLNESHGIVATRASNFSLLGPLRKAGFKYLAMETLTTKAPSPDDGACPHAAQADPGLAARGYPILADAEHVSGYYFEEPVYAQIVREALRLGYTLVPYESVMMKTPSAREQDEADSLACLFKADAQAKLVVIAGFGHIAEKQDHAVPGGMMAYRFKQATGIDPLSVDSTVLLGLDATRLRLAPGKQATAGEALVLRNAAGHDYGDDEYDLVLHVPDDGHREGDSPGWLPLGGTRKPSFVPASCCAGRLPCLVEARVPGELPNAVPSDRCVIGDVTQRGCTLYLRPGRYLVGTQDEHQAVIGKFPLRLR